MEKDFNNWNNLKIKLDKVTQRILPFRQNEIWWCDIGLNIGHEENGKNKNFNRPVLIIKKFNHHLFWGIPLTTKIKNDKYYHRIQFKDKEQCLMLSQLRVWDSRRLEDKIGELNEKEAGTIRRVLSRLINP